MKTVLATAQYPITQHSGFEAWRDHTEQWVLNAVRQKAQILLFPEYGSMELMSLLDEATQKNLRGQIQSLQRYRDDYWQVFAQLARRHEIILVAPSFPVAQGEKIYNRAAVFSPKGLAGYQDKLFMTRFEAEDWGIHSAPPHFTVFEADWGRFGIQICYDVEFPVGAHLLSKHGATLLLAPSCTETIRGAARVHVGARARALENQCYVAVAQTVGMAPWSLATDINYGYAAVYSTPDLDLPEEGILALHAEPQRPGWLVQELDFSKIERVREDGQVLNFRDHQRIGYGLKESKEEVILIAC